MAERRITVPRETASPTAMFFEDENPQEAALLEIQQNNGEYIWNALIQREDFRGLGYTLPDGRQQILSPSTREGIDWQLSYIGSDEIPTMHGDYLEGENIDPMKGHTMKELYRELHHSTFRHDTEVTLLLEEKGERNMDEKQHYLIDDISFIVDMAKLYAVYNRIPIDPESEYFKAYEKNTGEVLNRAEYQRILTDTLVQGERPPRMAILQPQEDGLIFRRWREVDKSRVVSGNYEVTYISDELGNATPEEVYAEFNKPEARPGNYYGHSVSTGDIIAYEKDGVFSAFYADSFGFQELPETFFDRETVWKIRLGLDVREEHDLLKRHIDFTMAQGIDLDVTADQERLAAIDRDFDAPFRLADLRETNRQYQDVLKIIYDFQQESETNYGITYEEGTYYATRQRDGRAALAADTAAEYQTEIQKRLERAAQRIGQNNENLYRMEANPYYRGGEGEYPFFIQRYHSTEQGTRTPEEVVYLGEADSAAYLVAHMNAGTLYGEAILQNIRLRQTLREPPLTGGIFLTSDEAEMENMNLSDRISERTETIRKAMEAAGYYYDEINSAGEPDGTQYFSGRGGTMQFESESEALDWLENIGLEPESAEAVERILHPERYESEQAQEEAQEINHYPEIYIKSSAYAREHGELEQFRESWQLNRECRESIDLAIRDNFDGMHLNPDALKPVLEEYGAERTALILAATVQYHDGDGRFSRSNREWANNNPLPDSFYETNEQSNYIRPEFIASSHPAVLDGFIDTFREEMRNREQERQEEKSFTQTGEIVARYQSTQDMQDGYINNIAIIREADGYHNHFLFDEYRGKGAAGTGAFATLEEARQDVIAHYPDAKEILREQERPHGEDERITLHIRYSEPVSINGWTTETDTLTFDSREELDKYINGEAAYDTLDNAVRKRDNEILLYAENEGGKIIWQTPEWENSSFTAYDGNVYEIIDHWEDNWGQDTISLTVGRDRSEDGDFYLAIVQSAGERETIYREYEFDEPPTRDGVYGRFVDDEAMRDIDRREARAMGMDLEQEAAETQEYVYYSLHRPVDIGNHPRDGLVTFENFDRRTFVENIGREAWGKLTYSRELSEQEVSNYEFAREGEAEKVQIRPIREFAGADGKILVGSDIGFDPQTGQVDRRRVYQAVQIFENRNPEAVPEDRRIIGDDGDYADRQTLYDGYDRYVGMSHRDDPVLAPYAEIIALAAGERAEGQREEAQDRYTAEAYYAVRNGLTGEQVEFMLTNCAYERFPEETMRNVRLAFEQGMSEEQVALTLGQDVYTQQTMLSILHDGGSMEQIRAMQGADMDVAHYIQMGYRDGSITAEKATSLVKAANLLSEAAKEKNLYSEMTQEAHVAALAELTKDPALTPEGIEKIAADFAAQGNTEVLNDFVQAQGGIKAYYPHREDGQKPAPLTTEQITDISFRSRSGQDSYFFARIDGTPDIITLHRERTDEGEAFNIYSNADPNFRDFTNLDEYNSRTLQGRLGYDECFKLERTLRGVERVANWIAEIDRAQTPDELIDFRWGIADMQEQTFYLTQEEMKPVDERLSEKMSELYIQQIQRAGTEQEVTEAIRGMEADSDYISTDHQNAVRDAEAKKRLDLQVQSGETVLFAAASQCPRYKGIAAFITQDDKVYVGKPENYDNQGHYNNTDHSLIHIADGQRAWDFIRGTGLTLTVEETIKSLNYTEADFAEMTRIENALKDAGVERVAPYTFADVPFMPDGAAAWAQTAQELPHREDERSREMPKEQEKAASPTEGLTMPEEKKSKKDELSEKLLQGVKEVMEGEKYKNFLATSSSYFTNGYSLRNAILIFSQKPDASYVKGYEGWKDFGRNVAQGAKGAQIFVPVMAYDKTEGALYRMIMSDLRKQVNENPDKVAAYKVGMSNVEFTMSKSGQVGLRIGGAEKGIFQNEQQMKQFISQSILGKVPMYFTVGTVFDVKDTVVPEYLWVKKGYTKDEVVKDDNGKPIKNRKGEVKIYNTPERQARFQPHLDLSIAEKDPEKMKALYAALVSVSEKNGIPVTEVPREQDEALRDGADGYFSRQFTEDKPKGFIIMPDDLEPTKKCAVLMHEMGHSDLHGNLAKLAAEMGENKIPRHMREIQAESVAFATARQFGIETNTSSFTYLAEYSKGFELQDLQKSLNVIYKEAEKLTQEIGAELDARGLNLDLTERGKEPMEKDSVKTLCKQYTAYALEQSEAISTKMKELPSLAADNRSNPALLSVVTAQKTSLDRQMGLVDAIHADVKALQGATTREEQTAVLERLEASKRGMEAQKTHFSDLVRSFSDIASEGKPTLKEQFARDPQATLEAMKKEYPKLQSLSSLQLSYIAKSDYIKWDSGNLLKSDPAKFVDMACQRAEALDKAISKNGVFVEVKLCEQWTDKPIVQGGALLHPKVADSIIKQGEVQIQGLKAEAEKTGEYFPYVKCDLTVFSKSGEDFTAYRTRVDIGDGGQTSLSDHLKQLCGEKSELVTAFDKATREKGAKEKFVFNEMPEPPKEAEQTKEAPAPAQDKGAKTMDDWQKSISEEKAKTGQAQEQGEKDVPQKTNKDDKEH